MGNHFVERLVGQPAKLRPVVGIKIEAIAGL
jgi:hypothetical protein